MGTTFSLSFPLYPALQPPSPRWTGTLRDMDIPWVLQPLYQPKDAGEFVSDCHARSACSRVVYMASHEM